MSELLYFHQTFTYYISNQYVYVKMSNVAASYGMPLNFITFFLNLAQNCRILMSEVLNMHQTFADCLINRFILICQM